jgi:ribosome recycling factor
MHYLMFNLVLIEVYLLIRYFKCLSQISTLSKNQQKLLNITVFEEDVTTFALSKDIKFFYV